MMRLVFFCYGLLSLFPSFLVNAQASENSLPPKIWIFVGIAGNEQYLQQFELDLKVLRRALDQQYNLPDENISILFGRGTETNYQACNAENLRAEFKRIRDVDKAGNPIFVIFAGHANSTEKNGINFNIPGKDLSAADIKKELAGCENSLMAIFFALPAANRFIKPLTAKNRLVVAAVEKEDDDNQTVYFTALTESFTNTDNDLNRDGSVSALELFEAAQYAVEDYYFSEGYIQEEVSVLDGNGDGKPVSYPKGKEAENGKKLKLKINESY